MAEYNDDFTVDTEQDSALVKDLRAQLRKAHDRAKAAETERDTFKTQARTATVGDLLKAKGLQAKVAKYVPDTVNDEASLEEWLAGDGDVFAAMKTAPAEESTTPVEQELVEEQGMDPALAELFGKINATEASATPVTAGAEQRLSAGLDALSGKSPAEIAEAFRTGKIPV